MKDCGIVKDLLPLYAENMASEESTAFVTNHIEQCEACRAALETLRTPVKAAPAAPLITVRKAVKKRGWLLAGLIACLVASLALGVFARLMKPIPIAAPDAAFAEVTVIPETIPLPAPQTGKVLKTEAPKPTESETRATAPEPTEPEAPATPEPRSQQDAELELVKQVQKQIVVMLNENSKSIEISYIIVPDETFAANAEDSQSAENTHTSIGFTLVIPEITGISENVPDAATETPEAQEEKTGKNETVAYVYSVPDQSETHGRMLEPEAVIPSTSKTLKLTPKWDTSLLIERTGNEISIGAYTTLWDMRHPHAETLQEFDLSGVDAVFFEPYNNTDRVVLYQREGYTPEAGFALPRLVMNYYFLIALIGTAILAVVWLVLRLCKREKAARVLGLLLLIACGFVLAFLAAGFPATTIAPLRELAFVLVIALLLIGAGLCGRRLLRKD